LFSDSPLEFIDNLYQNNIYIKREDKLPYSFGGNKVRFAEAFLEDMKAKGKNAIIAYGSKSSNLCRVMSQLCFDNHIPCAVIFSETSGDTNNSKIISALGVREYACEKARVAETVNRAIEDFKEESFDPYYIYGNTKGEGNELVPVSSYTMVYDEITAFEKENNINFDYIFLATGTAATYSGLLSRACQVSDTRKIIGISVARDSKRCKSIIQNNLNLYFNKEVTADITVTDEYLFGGYSKTIKDELAEIDYIFKEYDIPLDPTYTGKAFFGMKNHLYKNNIKNKNILFIHTGGYPLFCDYKGIKL